MRQYPVFIRVFWVTLLGCVVFAPSSSMAETGRAFYVSSSTGHDEFSGRTPHQPFRSFRPLTNFILQPGDVIRLQRGDTWSEELRLRGRGNSNSPVRLESYGAGPRPVIARTDRRTDRCVMLENPSHWRVRDLECRSAKLGIYLRYEGSAGHRDVQIEDCVFQDLDDPTANPAAHAHELAWSCGIFVGGRLADEWAQTNVLTGLTIRNCHFTNCAAGIGTAWYFPPPYFGRLRDVTIEDCLAVDCMNGALQLNHVEGAVIRRVDSIGGGGDVWAGTTLGFLNTCRKVLIEDCIFAGCDRHQSADGSGFDFEGNCQDVQFRRNLVVANDGPAVMFLSTLGQNRAVILSENVFVANARNPWNSDTRAEIMNSDVGSTGVMTNNWFFRRDELVPFQSASPAWTGWTVGDNRFTTFAPGATQNWLPQAGAAGVRFQSWLARRPQLLPAKTATLITVLAEKNDSLRAGIDVAGKPISARLHFWLPEAPQGKRLVRATLGVTRAGIIGANPWSSGRYQCLVEADDSPADWGRLLIAYRDGLRLFTPLPVERIRQRDQLALNLHFRPAATTEPVLFTHGAASHSGGESVVVFDTAADVPSLELAYE